ncbi:MAG: hypothetical protein ACOZIN_22520 [Myxococcota bacterium]
MASETPAAACPFHPDEVVTGTCTLCGRYVCLRCVKGDGSATQGRCPQCVARASAGSDFLYRGLAVSALVRGAVVAALLGFSGAFFPSWGPATKWALGAAGALFYVGYAAVLWKVRKPMLAWGGFALDLVVFGGLALALRDRGPLALILLALPLSSAFRAVRLNRG